ncbi:MAG: molybdenum cofactor guanylyltransferase [Bacteroidetes bacterium]|nr:molybdenum cofactor guanylyltransferase [Bacteroidota bacterium]
MTGVVLCGGQSLRMGRDKGLMVSANRLWAEIVRGKLVQTSIPSVLSVNSTQKENYLRHFDENDLVVDNSAINIQGPLQGLLSVHLKYPDQDLMVVACDMINVEIIVLKKLLNDFNASRVAAIAFKGERVEPLCAIYSSPGLAKILSAYRQSKLSNYSMMYILEELNAKYIPIPEEWQSYFRNFNSAEDL